MVIRALWITACWGDRRTRQQEGQDSGLGPLSKTDFLYVSRHTLSYALCLHSSSNPNDCPLRNRAYYYLHFTIKELTNDHFRLGASSRMKDGVSWVLLLGPNI